VQQDNF